MKTKLQKANELIRELVEHLDYCGWGDRWERECAENLREKTNRYIDNLNAAEERLKKIKKNS